MPISFQTYPVEGGTAILTLTFTDEDGQSITPKTLAYTIVDFDGQMVNNKQDVPLTPAQSVDIVLTGDDLPAGTLYVVITGTYDSTAGNDLPLVDYVILKVKKNPAK